MTSLHASATLYSGLHWRTFLPCCLSSRATEQMPSTPSWSLLLESAYFENSLAFCNSLLPSAAALLWESSFSDESTPPTERAEQNKSTWHIFSSCVAFNTLSVLLQSCLQISLARLQKIRLLPAANTGRSTQHDTYGALQFIAQCADWAVWFPCIN